MIDCGIYGIYTPTADKIYVGQSSNIKSRLNSHSSLLQRNKHYNYKLQEAFNLDKVFEAWIIQKCSIADLNDIEQYWMDQFDVVSSGLNIEATSANLNKSGTFSTAKYKYTKEQIFKVFELLLDCKNTRAKISEITGIPIGYITSISTLKRHSWLADEFPEKISLLEQSNVARFRASNDPLTKGLTVRYIVKSPDGLDYEITNIAEFSRKHKLNSSWLCQLVNQKTPQHKGWVFIRKESLR